MSIEYKFCELFHKKFRNRSSEFDSAFIASWDHYKKTHNIKTETEETGYSQLILNPFGGHYYVPNNFIAQVVFHNYVPPMQELPAINTELMLQKLSEKYKEITDFNKKVPTYTSQDRNWDRYLCQINAVLNRTRKSYYIRSIPEDIEFGGKYDYIWVKDPYENYQDLIGIKFNIAQDIIENGAPEINFELERFQPNYRMMESYQPW